MWPVKTQREQGTGGSSPCVNMTRSGQCCETGHTQNTHDLRCWGSKNRGVHALRNFHNSLIEIRTFVIKFAYL